MALLIPIVATWAGLLVVAIAFVAGGSRRTMAEDVLEDLDALPETSEPAGLALPDEPGPDPEAAP